MKMVIFDQWEALVKRFRSIASSAAAETAQYAFNAVEPEGGHVRLADRAVNTLSLDSAEATVHVPDISPGKARDFVFRVKVSGECGLSFTGCESFEGEEGALEPPSDGDTAVYFFTETEPDVLLVTRKIVTAIDG